MSRRAIFLDRDGVINVNRSDHVKSWEEFRFLPGTFEALRRFASSSFLVAIATNQAIINRHIVDESTVQDIHRRMRLAVEQHGGYIHAVYYCPHTPDEVCDCRKPQPGMYLRAAREHDVDLSGSYVIGDARADVQAARKIGALPILVLTGRDCEYRRSALQTCTDCETRCIVLNDLLSAAEWIEIRERVRL